MAPVATHILLLAALVPLTRDVPLPTRDVRELLTAQYTTRDAQIWHGLAVAVHKVRGGEPAEAAKATDWLWRVLEQTMADEMSGTAPWEATPFWGGGGDNPARSLRRTCAQRLAEAPSGAAAVPLLEWFLDRDTVTAHQALAAQALGKVRGPEAAKLRADAITASSNLGVVVELLKQAKAFDETLPADKLKPLCHHHRPGVRTAARDLNTKLGYPDPGAFDQLAAVKAQPVADLMAAVGKLWLDQPPADAKFVAATERTTQRDPPDTIITRGWLLTDDGTAARVFTEFGRVRTMTRGTADDQYGLQLTRVDVVNLADEVARVEKLRGEGDKGFAFSERGGLRGQFRGTGASVPETLLAYRLYSTGQFDLAARVLFPALDTVPRDADLVDRFRHELGIVYGHRMLAAFAGDRDYARTARLADVIVKTYPDTAFTRYAVRLADELPRRRGDFSTFALPTLSEWQRFSKTSTRAQQIDYLCERLRLLNGFQDGQPGGADTHAAQYAEPCGISDDAAWGLRRGQTKLVNPLNALVGANPYTLGKWAPGGLRPTVADIPTLSKHLRTDWLMPSVSFFRDFAPNRTLHSTREEIGGIINRTAGFDLCELKRWDKLTPAEVGKEIERIDRWASGHADLPPPPLPEKTGDATEELLGKEPAGRGEPAGQPKTWRTLLWYAAIGAAALVAYMLIRRRYGRVTSRKAERG